MRSPFAPRSRPAAFAFRSVGRSHRGCVRTLNEDAILEAGQAGLWAVADGMGGLEAGDVASRTVIETLSDIGPAAAPSALSHDVAEALHRANRRLIDYAAERGAEAVGSTVVALLANDGHYACVWAGDSRGYLWRRRTLTPLTRDHSLVQELVDQGAMTAVEARSNRLRNVVTRAVGVDAELDLQMQQGQVEPEDLFLLCSDGLTGMLDDDELAAELAGAHDLDACADRLIEQALRRGAPDNVSLILVRAEAAAA